MTGKSRRYANTLLEFAEEHGLEEIYRQALILVVGGNPAADKGKPLIRTFLDTIPESEHLPVLFSFVELAREKIDLLPTEIISSVTLTTEQLTRLEEKLIRMFRKQLDITTTVDPSLIGGLRIIVGNTVFDESIKRKLHDMKDRVYRGVYFSNDT